MSRRLSFAVRGWAFGLTAYALVFTREVPVALAQVPLDTDCSTELDQPNTTYVLTGDVAGNCIIAADNVILDGQGLYEISDGISTNTYSSFTVRNIPSVSYVGTYYEGDVTIENSSIESYAYTYEGNLTIADSTILGDARANYGELDITDSTITSSARGFLGVVLDGVVGDLTVVADTGNILITNDSFVNTVQAQTGDVSIVNSEVTDYILAPDGEISVSGSAIGGYINARSIGITDSQVSGYVQAYYNTTVVSSAVAGDVFSDEGAISVTDSEVLGQVDAETTVLIANSEITGQVAGDGVTVTDSTFGDKIWSRVGDVSVTNSTVAGAVVEPSFRSRPVLFASIPHGDGYSTGYDSENAISANFGNITVSNSLLDGTVWMSGATPDGLITIERSTVYGNVMAQNNSAAIIDSEIIEGSITADELTLIDNAPSLTITPLDFSLGYNEKFNPFDGVSADDIKDGDLGNEVVVIGEVGKEQGVYTLLYSVTDGGTSVTWNGDATSTGPHTSPSVTRTVTRTDKPTESTAVGKYKERKEKEIKNMNRSTDLDATLIALKAVLAQPLATNDPDQLKRLINALLQLMALLVQLIAVEGKQ